MGAKGFPKGADIITAQSGWIKADAGVPVKISQIGYIESFKKEIKQLIVEKVHTMYVEYKNNPYFLITGFSIEVGLPPSANLDFEFK